MALSERLRPAAERPTRLLPRSAVCAAIAPASSGGHPGNYATMKAVISATNCLSCSSRRAASTFRRSALWSASLAHSASARAIASEVARIPCRSYQFSRLNDTFFQVHCGTTQRGSGTNNKFSDFLDDSLVGQHRFGTSQRRTPRISLQIVRSMASRPELRADCGNGKA